MFKSAQEKLPCPLKPYAETAFVWLESVLQKPHDRAGDSPPKIVKPAAVRLSHAFILVFSGFVLRTSGPK
jgi:hypothetical protein